ncbi:hypothetical protein [Nocardia sp. NPDC057227]|uniref:hypothetical protein n=1 Tax=Nocardia sp. NPDC057227 TaxID=3346056 RepID=UPI003633C5BD
MRKTLIVAALIALPVLAGCGGEDVPPPLTAADLSKSLQDKGLKPASLADCAAKVFVDAGISQEGLRTLISDDQAAVQADPQNMGMSEADAAKAREARGKMGTECVAGVR